MTNSAPLQIGGARVLMYAVIDSRHRPTENCRHIVGSNDFSRAGALAICQYPDAHGYYLLYCDAAWNEITDTWHQALDDAMNQAEFEYAGITETWHGIA